MKHRILFLLSLLTIAVCSAADAAAAARGPLATVNHDFVPEHVMMRDLMQMLADFSRYMSGNVEAIADTNSAGESMISFRGENTLGNNEQGVRHNADMSMVCAALCRYGRGLVTLPDGVTWERIEELARRSLVYAYSTHRANRLYPCKNNSYWGAAAGSGQWESSLWAMSVAYSAFFQWDSLTDAQRGYIRALLESECDYELGRDIPTGWRDDTKAEENGWEADVLAAALGLFPDHPRAAQWYARLREFAVNSYSHPSDATDTTVIDPGYDSTTVADLYIGPNLFDDWTLQNHSLFHTSYQNVVMQELGEAALALKLFQTGLHGHERWHTNALMHNNRPVMQQVFGSLALADGELAMPNGNDWSLFLYDQITSYTTMACFLGDADALFLENMAYKHIKARQTTTGDGSWLLRADVGARRMGVEAHRVLMTWLMHHTLSTAALAPSTWQDILDRYGETKIFPDQNVICSATGSRFTTFSWSRGLKSYTGYIVSHNPALNKTIVPFRAHNTGNFLGWYEVDDRPIDAVPVVSGVYRTDARSFVMNGELLTNGGALDNRFAIYSTPGNAVIYLDRVCAEDDVTVRRALGGLMAISMDEFTATERDIYTADCPGGRRVDGDSLCRFATDWANIDNDLGFVSPGNRAMALGDRANNNSIMTAKLYPLYSDTPRSVTRGELVDSRYLIYYTSVSAAETEALRDRSLSLAGILPEGWGGIIAADPDGAYYLLLSNFAGHSAAHPAGITLAPGAPVFTTPTQIVDSRSTATFETAVNTSCAQPLRAFVRGTGLMARSDSDNPERIYLRGTSSASSTAEVTIITPAGPVTGTVTLSAGITLCVSADSGAIVTAFIHDAALAQISRP